MLKVDIQSFSYKEQQILKDISFNLKMGDHLVILGESGCGKSTLLHLIYGLLHLEHGKIFWKKKQLRGPKHNLIPGEAFVKLVAQEYDLMPFISVSENIAAHLDRRDQESDDQRVAELLKVVDLETFERSMVKTLSGGQKQRVVLAKALANKPELLLLDEPFSSIDVFRKNALRRDLFNYLKKNEISCITATHDSEEALAFADTILILKDGKIEAYGSPEKIFREIDTPYQAGFFGEVTILPSHFFASEDVSEENKERVLLPHQLKLSKTKTNLAAIVKKSYFRGTHYLIACRFNSQDLFFEHSEKIKPELTIYLKLS
ncbi:ABC transporter ATP-binding protein [Ulvibacter antarcticus]|uniref:ABC-type Fe3+/spermidine/putrescine transport system ATPase subunit n=1 Tax=Ulvibacter antarcticus TaxID=442714 RepID=A0A3L9Z1R0_9FLAO|nr:ABC transporter ATP-binding protein [Ulvibacter antarcticus]RMA66060.1 ABC-type Fe3+/spermidine/putrescine transport system ATPase subunit [Ulvibacter antarcticus]